METKKIIKSLDVVFFEDKMHLENCPSGRIEEPPAVKMDISTKSDVEELEVSGDVKEPDMEKPNIEDEFEAEVPAAKSTCSG